MTITIKSNPDGVSGAIQVNGVDKVTIGASGITAGSFAPNSIDAAAAALAFSGANQSLASSGYQKLPSGIILQWYNTNVTIPANSSLTITLPIAFPSTHAACVATARNGLSPNSGLFSVVNTSTTQATVHNNGVAVSNGVYLFAIGY